MSSPFAKPSENQGGSFFKPADHMTVLALLVEPKSIQKNVENNYQGSISHRDEVTADVTIFNTSEALATGVPTSIQKNSTFTHGMLTSTLERIMGGATVAVVRKVPTKRGEGFAFRDVDSTVEGQVAVYYTNREAARTEALANVPSFA